MAARLEAGQKSRIQMTHKSKLQLLPQGRATDEWLLRRVVEVLENVLAEVKRLDEKIEALEQKLDAADRASKG